MPGLDLPDAAQGGAGRAVIQIDQFEAMPRGMGIEHADLAQGRRAKHADAGTRRMAERAGRKRDHEHVDQRNVDSSADDIDKMMCRVARHRQMCRAQ